MKLELLFEELKNKYNCIILRDNSSGGDIDLFSENPHNEELIKFMLMNDFILICNSLKYVEFVKFFDTKFISLEISCDIFRGSKFPDIYLKNKYLKSYINNPVSNDLWFRCLKYLLTMNNSEKAKLFFDENHIKLIENNYFLDYLNESPFIEVNLNYLINRKNFFIIYCIKFKYKFKLLSLKFSNLYLNNKNKKLVPIVGVDGAGKSTLIDNLVNTSIFKDIYFGGRGFVLENYYNKLLSKNKIFVPFVRLFQYLENLCRYLKGIYIVIFKGKIVLFDRLPSLEYYITNSNKMKFFYFLFYRFLFPKFDKVIFISGNEEEIFSRKKELTIKEIKYFQNKIRNSGFNLIEIKNINNSLDKTLNDILKEIYA